MVTDAALRDLARVLTAGGLQDNDALADACGLDSEDLLDVLAVASEHGLARHVPGRTDAWCATFRARRLAAARVGR